MEDMSKRRRRKGGKEMGRQRVEQKIEKKQHQSGTGAGKTIRRGRGGHQGAKEREAEALSPRLSPDS